MTTNRVRRSLCLAVLLLLAIASHRCFAQGRGAATGDLVLDYSKPVDELLSFPAIDSVDRHDDMANDDVCANSALGQSKVALQGVWASRVYKQLGKTMLKYALKPVSWVSGADSEELAALKSLSDKAAEIAEIALNAKDEADFKEKMVEKVGEEAAGRLGKNGNKLFRKIYEHFLPPASDPTQDAFDTTSDSCKLHVEFTVVKPAAGRKGSIHVEVRSLSCRPLRAPGLDPTGKGQPDSFTLIANSDLEIHDQGGRLVPTATHRSYILSGECGKFAGCKGFQGTWSADYSSVTFTVTGDHAVGSYTWQGAGTIDGTVTDGTLQGTWKDGSGSGKLTLTLDKEKDNQVFTGSWTRSSGDGNPSGAWNGSCRQP